MNARHLLAALVVALSFICGISATFAAPVVVGDWIFGKANTNPSADLTGNFGPLTLHGGASIAGGQLTMSAAGDYAISGNYTGPVVTDKTLVAWVSLSSLTPGGGTALTLETNSGNTFDGIVYAENTAGVWNAGSDGFNRTNQSPVGTAESTTNQLIEMAITYQHTTTGSETISVYRDGVLYNTPYTLGTAQTYDNLADSAITDAIFGRRHGQAGGQPYLPASIVEARIYSGVLTAGQISSLQQAPEPASLVLCGLGGIGLLLAVRRNRKA